MEDKTSSCNGYIQHQCNGNKGTMEMSPMLNSDKCSHQTSVAVNGAKNSKCSPNISHQSVESIPCQKHYVEHELSKTNIANDSEQMNSELQKPLKCDNKINSSFYSSHLTPTVKCLTLHSTFHYKVITALLGSCIVGLLCLILIIFLVPHLFFKSQGKHSILITIIYLGVSTSASC